jgi:hypothetical protein
MATSRDRAERYRDHVRLQLAGRNYLSEAQEKELLLAALDHGIAIEEAKRLLAATAAERKAALASKIEAVVLSVLETLAGNRGWISPAGFRHAAAMYRRLSEGAIGEAEAKARLKQMMLQHRWQIRGALIFGAPKWFRDIPERPAATER